MRKIVFWISSNRGTDKEKVFEIDKNTDGETIDGMLEEWCRGFGCWEASESRINYGWSWEDEYDGFRPLNDEWKHLHIGNVVLWGKSLWVVSKVKTDGLELLSYSSSNHTAHPSIKWPKRNNRIDTVKYLASCVKDFINSQMNSLKEIT